MIKRTMIVVVGLAACTRLVAQDAVSLVEPETQPAIQAGVTADGDVAMWADILALGDNAAVEKAPLLAKPFVAVWEGGKTLAAQAIEDPGETLGWVVLTYAGVRAAQGELDDDLKSAAEGLGLRDAEKSDDGGGDEPDPGGSASADDSGASATAPTGGDATSINIDLQDIDAPVTVNVNTGNPVTMAPAEAAVEAP